MPLSDAMAQTAGSAAAKGSGTSGRPEKDVRSRNNNNISGGARAHTEHGRKPPQSPTHNSAATAAAVNMGNGLGNNNSRPGSPGSPGCTNNSSGSVGGTSSGFVSGGGVGSSAGSADSNSVTTGGGGPGSPADYRYLSGLVPELRAELRNRDVRVQELEGHVKDLRSQVCTKEDEIARLKQEIHKVKSVLQATAPNRPQDGSKADILSTLHEQHSMAGQGAQAKRQGVSGESFNPSQNSEALRVDLVDKDVRSKLLIKDAILENDFLKNLDALQVKEIVDCMYSRRFPKGSLVIREGEPGSHLYVSADGELIVRKDGHVLGKMGSGKAFGELAILYNCTRTASVEALTDATVWVLDRRVFQMIMMRTGLQRQEQHINFLRSVPLLKNLSAEILSKIADVLEVDFYPADEYIVRQGGSGDTFFIINSGKVKVTQRLLNSSTEEEIRTLEHGDYFGEQALLREDCRTANVIALAPGVECLTLDRESFNQLIGDLQELQDKDYGDQVRILQRPPSAIGTFTDPDAEYAEIALDQLEVVATLGDGGFGRVVLVQHIYDRTKTFALKCLTKQRILETQQQEHIYSEKTIMMSCRSPFIARLYKTFKDRKFIYMLIEPCLGGEVWTILRDKGVFDDHTTRFYTACVVEAFEYLHTRGIIYRDLKPENLLLDSLGYCKLVDFGFSKKLRNGQKTWTFCGTPEYVAPEIIINKGHDRAVDYWSLGILMFELFTGTPPFAASDPMKTYTVILKGIDMVDFPRSISRHAQSLIKRLCRESPSERLGYQKNGISDIKKHKWFQGFDWDGLMNQTLLPPFVPEVNSPTDVSNFDCYPKQIETPPDDLTGWDKDF